MRGYNLSPRMAEEVAKVVRDYMNQSQLPSAKKGFKRERVQQEDVVQVKCTVAIPAAEDSFATPSTTGKAKFQVSDSSGVLSDYSPEIEVEVINHSESDSWDIGDYLKIHFIDGKWHPYSGGTSGGGGSGGGSCSCVHLEQTPFQHPHLPSGEDDCAQVWEITAIGEITGPTSDGNGEVRLPVTNNLQIQWEDDQTSIYADVTDLLEVYDNSGTDVTGSSTPTGYIEMRFDVSPPHIHLSIDATIP